MCISAALKYTDIKPQTQTQTDRYIHQKRIKREKRNIPAWKSDKAGC